MCEYGHYVKWGAEPAGWEFDAVPAGRVGARFPVGWSAGVPASGLVVPRGPRGQCDGLGPLAWVCLILFPRIFFYNDLRESFFVIIYLHDYLYILRVGS